MWLEIDYKTAKKRYPKEVEDVTKKVRAGKSKHRNSDPNLWAWGFSWCVQIEGAIGGQDFLKMITGEKEFPKDEEPETADEEVADYARRAMVHLAAKIGKTQWGSTKQIEFPNEIGNRIRTQFEKDKAEQARVDALSPEERERETNDILRQLSRSPGFMAIGMGPGGPMPRGIVAQGSGGPDDVLFKPLPNDGVGSIIARIKSLTGRK
jgi:hypothetical protein